MHRYQGIFWLLVIWLLAGLACGLAPNAALTGAVQTPTLVETDACCLHEPDANATLSASQQEEATTSLTATPVQAEQPALPAAAPAQTASAPQEANAQGLLRQWARFGSLEPYELSDIAIGKYQADFPACGEAALRQLPEESGELVLTLSYNTPLLLEQVEIFHAGDQEGFERIELLNSLSGLGIVIDQQSEAIQHAPLTEGACRERLIIPVHTDFEIDTIFITFKNLDAAAQIGAVEMLGRLEDYVDAPVYWRVPLTNTPVDLAMGSNGQVYAVTQATGLYSYDLEGNQLEQFPISVHEMLNAVTADAFGNLIVTGTGSSSFLVLSPQGEQLVAGGSETYYQAAVNPLDGNLYLLTTDSITVFTSDTAELVRLLPLDTAHSFIGLAFDPQGRIYTLRDYDWSPTLLALDASSGEELDAISLMRSNLGEINARDLAVDESGNIYVLFSMNTGQVAVHMLDPRGNFVRRFGSLSDTVEGWPEGSFLDPRAITVSPDGRFILIADGFDSTSYLTAFLMEPD